MPANAIKRYNTDNINEVRADQIAQFFALRDASYASL